MSANDSGIEFFAIERRQGLTSAERSKLVVNFVQEASNRQATGQSVLVIVTDSPTGTHSVVRKYWHRLRRKLEKERALTLDTSKRGPLDRQLEIMETLPFKVGHPGEATAGVFFIEPHQLTDVLGLDEASLSN